MECFLYQALVQWFQNQDFDACHIDINSIRGGIEGDNEPFCAIGPCLYLTSPQRRRLLHNEDGNMTVLLIANDLGDLPLKSMANELETQHLNEFGVHISVTILS